MRYALKILGILGVFVMVSSFSTVSTYADGSGNNLPTPMEYATPPHGFNPLTATAQQLAYYGFPKRPSGGNALAQWTYAMSHATQYVPAGVNETLQGIKFGISDQYSPSWAGYDGLASANGGSLFYETDATFTQPTIQSCGCSGDVGIWTGIGGAGSSTEIIQAGTLTQTQAASQPTYTAFYEDYPENPHAVSAPSVSPGDQIYVSVTYSNGETTFYIENETTGAYHSYPVSTPYYDGSSADWIVEKPTASTYLPPFTPSVPFTGAWTMDSQSIGDVGGLTNLQKQFLTSNGLPTGTPLATPSNLNSYDGFTVTWNNLN
jgi:hypothetical protein